jgi:O-antigen ligase
MAVARWSFYAIAVLLPWATSNFTLAGFQPYPWTSNMFELPKLLALHTCLTAAGIAWLFSLFARGAHVRVSRAHGLMGAAALLVVASTATSGAIGLAFVGRDPRYAGALLLLDLLAASFLATQCFDTQRSRREFAWVLVASAAALSVYSLIQYAGYDPISWGQGFFDTSRPSATFGNPTILGGFLVLPLALSVALSLGSERTTAKVWGWLSATLIGLAVLITFTRGAWLGSLIGLAAVGIAFARSGRRPTRTDWTWMAGLAAAVVLGIALSLASPNANTNVIARVVSAFDPADSGGSRVVVWRTAARGIAQQPLLGAGPSAFGWEYVSRAAPEALVLEGVGSYPDDAHSLPVHLAATVGLPAALLLLAFLLLVWRTAGRRVFARDSDPRLLLLAGYWGGTLGLFAHSALSVTTSYLVFLWIGVGVLAASGKLSSPRALAVSRGAGIVVGGVALLSLVLVLNVVRADALFMRGLMSGDVDARIALFQKATDVSQIQDIYPSGLGSAHLAEAERLFAAASSQGEDGQGTADLARAHLQQAELAFREAMTRAPREPDLYYRLGRLYLVAASAGVSSGATSAEHIIDQGLSRAPNVPSLLALKARALLFKGDVHGALEQAERAYGAFPGSMDILAALGEARLAAGDTLGAIDILDKARALAPGDPWIEELRLRAVSESPSP